MDIPYTKQFARVSRWLHNFPVQRVKFLRLSAEAQMTATLTLHKFFVNNFKCNIFSFEAEDLNDIIDTAAKNINVRTSDDKQYF